MAHGQLFSNNALALLEASIGPADPVIQVQTGLGELFPDPGPGEWFLVTLEDISSPINREIVRISSRSGDYLVVEARGYEGTTAVAWSADTTLVDHRITAGTLAALSHTAETTGVRVYDGSFSLSLTATTTVLTLPGLYAPASTAVFVGGLRQKRGVDYTESGPQQVTLNFVVSPADIADGQNIVVDYTAA